MQHLELLKRWYSSALRRNVDSLLESNSVEIKEALYKRRPLSVSAVDLASLPLAHCSRKLLRSLDDCESVYLEFPSFNQIEFLHIECVPSKSACDDEDDEDDDQRRQSIDSVATNRMIVERLRSWLCCRREPSARGVSQCFVDKPHVRCWVLFSTNGVDNIDVHACIHANRVPDVLHCSRGERDDAGSVNWLELEQHIVAVYPPSIHLLDRLARSRAFSDALDAASRNTRDNGDRAKRASPSFPSSSSVDRNSSAANVGDDASKKKKKKEPKPGFDAEGRKLRRVQVVPTDSWQTSLKKSRDRAQSGKNAVSASVIDRLVHGQDSTLARSNGVVDMYTSTNQLHSSLMDSILGSDDDDDDEDDENSSRQNVKTPEEQRASLLEETLDFVRASSSRVRSLSSAEQQYAVTLIDRVRACVSSLESREMHCHARRPLLEHFIAYDCAAHGLQQCVEQLAGDIDNDEFPAHELLQNRLTFYAQLHELYHHRRVEIRHLHALYGDSAWMKRVEASVREELCESYTLKVRDPSTSQVLVTLDATDEHYRATRRALAVRLHDCHFDLSTARGRLDDYLSYNLCVLLSCVCEEFEPFFLRYDQSLLNIRCKYLYCTDQQSIEQFHEVNSICVDRPSATITDDDDDDDDDDRHYNMPLMQEYFAWLTIRTPPEQVDCGDTLIEACVERAFVASSGNDDSPLDSHRRLDSLVGSFVSYFGSSSLPVSRVSADGVYSADIVEAPWMGNRKKLKCSLVEHGSSCATGSRDIRALDQLVANLVIVYDGPLASSSLRQQLYEPLQESARHLETTNYRRGSNDKHNALSARIVPSALNNEPFSKKFVSNRVVDGRVEFDHRQYARHCKLRLARYTRDRLDTLKARYRSKAYRPLWVLLSQNPSTDRRDQFIKNVYHVRESSHSKHRSATDDGSNDIDAEHTRQIADTANKCWKSFVDAVGDVCVETALLPAQQWFAQWANAAPYTFERANASMSYRGPLIIVRRRRSTLASLGVGNTLSRIEGSMNEGILFNAVDELVEEQYGDANMALGDDGFRRYFSNELVDTKLLRHSFVPRTAKDIVALAKSSDYFPPCMRSIILRAVDDGQHPNNDSRLQLVRFLASIGLMHEEIGEILIELYTYDSKFADVLSDQQPLDVLEMRLGFKVDDYIAQYAKHGGPDCGSLAQKNLCPFASPQRTKIRTTAPDKERERKSNGLEEKKRDGDITKFVRAGKSSDWTRAEDNRIRSGVNCVQLSSKTSIDIEDLVGAYSRTLDKQPFRVDQCEPVKFGGDACTHSARERQYNSTPHGQKLCWAHARTSFWHERDARPLPAGKGQGADRSAHLYRRRRIDADIAFHTYSEREADLAGGDTRYRRYIPSTRKVLRYYEHVLRTMLRQCPQMTDEQRSYLDERAPDPESSAAAAESTDEGGVKRKRDDDEHDSSDDQSSNAKQRATKSLVAEEEGVGGVNEHDGE